MYLGNIKNLSDDINLSDTTINRLSDFEFVKKCFEENFNFNKHDFKSNNITSSLNDIVYLKYIGFKEVSESHLFKCFFNTINNIKNSSKTVDIQNNLHKPDIVFNRTKDNIIEEISFYKKGEVANPILYIATKARYYKNGKFFRDGSKSGFLFSKNGYLLINDRPHCYLKFNKKNISLNYYANSRDKYDRKITISLPFIDCSFEKSASSDKEHILSVFGSKLYVNKLIKDFKNLDNIKFNSKTDVYNILTEDEIELLKIISI